MFRRIANLLNRFFESRDNEFKNWDQKYINYLQGDLQRTFGFAVGSHPAECLSAAYSYLERIESIFKARYPQFADSTPSIWIGNVRIANESALLFDDEEARKFAERPSADLAARKGYHAWVSIEGLIIDLTLLYYLEGRYDNLTRRQVIVATRRLTNNYGQPIEYFPYNSFTKTQLTQLAGL